MIKFEPIPEPSDFDKLLDCLNMITRLQHEMFKSLLENYDKIKKK